jgi:ferredoxin-NADP reductase
VTHLISDLLLPCDINSCCSDVMFRVAPPRAPRRLLAAASALTTPLLPEDFLGLVDPLWSQTELLGRVVAVRRQTARATTLRIRPGRRWSGHRAGQYVRVGVDVDGVRHWRTYSLDGDEADHHLSITVQALDGGVVSPQLAHGTPVGTVLHLEAATGDFVLPTPVPERLLMLTAGSGITPVMGMLRTLAGRGPLPDVVLVHSAPTSDDVIFRDELRALAGLRLVVRHTREEGRFDLAELDELVPDHSDREVFACGPDGLLDAAEELWGERLHLERFTPPVRSTGGTGGTVAFGATAVDVDGGTSLLEAGESAGVLMPSGCRMGICHGCVLPLRDGQVRDLRTGEIHGEPGDLVQTCISGASGPVQIDI